MGPTLEELLQAVHPTAQRRAEPPRRVFERLQLYVCLLRDESPAGKGRRLLWRNACGEVATRAVNGEVVVGRDAACDVAFAVPRVSRRHCVVRTFDAGVEVEDLGSSNGTFVNGTRIQHRTLHEGDTIELGGMVMVYAG